LWAELLEIPYGETISFGELARGSANRPQFRAGAWPTGKNPISIIVRVIGLIGSVDRGPARAAGWTKQTLLEWRDANDDKVLF